MKSQNASVKHTLPLELRPTKVFKEPSTSTRDNVIYAEFSVPAKSPTIPNAIDIDDLVAELEQTDQAAEAVAKGRQWVAKSFYSNAPSSIALLRLRKGWSQSELAKRASTSQSYIARMELGNVDPQVSTVKKLARALGVPLATAMEAISPEDEQ